jgi:hypothetical protein
LEDCAGAAFVAAVGAGCDALACCGCPAATRTGAATKAKRLKVRFTEFSLNKIPCEVIEAQEEKKVAWNCAKNV